MHTTRRLLLAEESEWAVDYFFNREQDAVCSWNRREDGDTRDPIEIDAFQPGSHELLYVRPCLDSV